MNKHDTDGSVSLLVDEQGLATISFYHPAHNSLPSHLLEQLATHIAEAGQDPDVKLILIKSEGNRTFCAGASFDELMTISTEEEGFVFFSGFSNVINACRKCPRIILGRVQGKAVGGGVGLASAVDYCFATKYAGIRLSELAVGIGPFVIGPAVERKLGRNLFGQLALEPRVFLPATAALQQGFYASISEDAEAMDAAIAAKVEELSRYHADALGAIKHVLWEGTEHWDTLLEERARLSGRLILSEEAQSAIAAFKAGAR